jgi:class 3 adenylate cyclase
MIRMSFATRLTLVLIGLVVAVAGPMLVLVDRQTEQQVKVVTRRAAHISRKAFREVEQLHRAQLARLARAFTGSRRTLAALEAALESGERNWLIETARYELDLAQLESGFAAFSDARGTIVAALVAGVDTYGDPADVTVIARTALIRESSDLTAYRVINEQLFALTAERVELAGRAVGTVIFGVPLDGSIADHLGEVAGVEVCFAADGHCIAGTSNTDAALARLMASGSSRDRDVLTTVAGARWTLTSENVTPVGVEPVVRRVIAVPLDQAIAPFERIRAALMWIGLTAFPLAASVGILLSNRLSRPVRELVRATELVASGDLSTSVVVHSSDELGTLAASFNTMVEGLALKERYHDVLSKVVSREVANDLLAGQLQLGGETRNVTVVFADIVGFTSLAEGAPPRAVIATLNEFMTEWSRVIDEQGGVVDKYTGDGIMAIFGAPISHDDDALRALRAALRIQGTARRINEQRIERGEPTVALAFGIATGAAVAGNIGSPDRLNYTVVGESVNLASRLCSAAGPDEILIAESTMRAVRGRVAVTHRGTRHLKGLSQPVPVYGVVAERSEIIQCMS